jgi:hypothetical protein
MQNPTGFTIPKADLHRAYLRLLPWVVVGLAVPVALGITSLLAAIDTAAFLALLIGGCIGTPCATSGFFLLQRASRA